MVRDTWTLIKAFFNPIILWAGLMLAGPADILLFFNITESPVLAAPPYLLKPGQVGYTNFAFDISALIGLVTPGPYSDWAAARAARKNGGVCEAEMRLHALWIYMIITILSVILGSVAYQHQWTWGHFVVWGVQIQWAQHYYSTDYLHYLRDRLLQAHLWRDHGRRDCVQKHHRFLV